MDRQGFIDFNMRLSPEKSGKTDSYVRAIRILDEVLPHQNHIDLQGHSLYDISDLTTIDDLIDFVLEEQAKMRRQEQSIFDFGNPNQKSYPLKSFCSAALKSLRLYAQHEQDLAADRLIAHEANPQKISKKLVDFFDLKKEGTDKVSKTKQRRGQEYLRRMILANYGSRCAVTSINIPQLLLAGHIVPWEKSTPQQKLNPENGICLSALYDKAFDQGLITISPDDYTVILSSALRENETKAYYDQHFGSISGRKITLPTEYLPNRDFLAYHRENVFQGRT